MKPHFLIWLAACCGMLMAAPAGAVLVGIEFRDVANPNANPPTGVPYWTGYVDTNADTLTILTWYEQPGSGPAFWTPWIPDLSGGPMVWYARTHGGPSDTFGVRYDVPDDFGAGGDVDIGPDWGFISLTSARNMDWKEGNYNLVAVADYYPGWGAMVSPQPDSGTLKLQTAPNRDDDSPYDETTLPVWPYGSSGFGIRVVLGATVTATPYIPPPAAVPEVTALLPLGVLFLTQQLLARRVR